MSTRERKIKMRLFVQKKFAPHHLYKDHFPLYLYINFLGQNTKLSITEQGQTIYWNEQMVDAYNLGEKSGIDYNQLVKIDKLLEVIETVLRYEYSFDQDRYSLKGLRERLDNYEQDLFVLIEQKCKHQYFLDFKCKHPELKVDQSASLEMMIAMSQIQHDVFDPSHVVQAYLEIYIALYLFGEGLLGNSPLSFHERMIINWLKDDKFIFKLFEGIEIFEKSKEDIMNKLSNIQGLPKIRLYLINQFPPTRSRFEVYRILLKNAVE